MTALLTSAAVGFLFSLANGIVQRRHNGWPGFFQAIVTGVTAAVLVGLALKEHVPSETMRLAIAGACTIISDDIFAGLRAIGRLIREDPLGSIARLIDALRGRPGAASPPAPKPSED